MSLRGTHKPKYPPHHPLIRAQKNTAPSHPLTVFLNDADEADTRLSRLARQISRQPLDLNLFRAELLDKLHRVPYTQPRDPNRRKYTFYERMKAIGILSVFLRATTLREIWDWLVLRDSVRTDRELESKHLSVERYPLRFHSLLSDELFRHERKILAAISKYKVNERWLDDYLSAVVTANMRQLRILCLSKWPGSREPLLEKHTEEDVVARIGIFDLLQQCFAKPLPDRFLHRLTGLICSPPDVKEISHEQDEALRRALERRS